MLYLLTAYYKMKTLLLIFLSLSLSNQNGKLSGSMWIHKIGTRCIDTLTLLSNGKIAEYDCEMDYKFSGTYVIHDDILYLNVKDDSHSEDRGKITYYREKYIIKGNDLYVINTKNDKKSYELWFRKN